MNPTDAAKRTMLELTKRKLPPTPANYARIYGAMTGAEAMEPLSARMPDRAAAAALHEAIRCNDRRSVGQLLMQMVRRAVRTRDVVERYNQGWIAIILTWNERRGGEERDAAPAAELHHFAFSPLPRA